MQQRPERSRMKHDGALRMHCVRRTFGTLFIILKESFRAAQIPP